jgi:hypothetical protein
MPRGKRRDALAQANKSGNPIGFPDAAIAAISLLYGFQVATRNVVDFASIGAKIIQSLGEQRLLKSAISMALRCMMKRKCHLAALKLLAPGALEVKRAWLSLPNWVGSRCKLRLGSILFSRYGQGIAFLKRQPLEQIVIDVSHVDDG